MIRAGSLDRVITIQRNTPVQDDIGEFIDSWADVTDLRAKVLTTLGGGNQDTFEDDQELPLGQIRLRTRFLSSLTTDDRLIFEGETYNIISLAPFRRHEGWDILAEKDIDA